MKFLVLDDSNVDRLLLTSLLHELGHEAEAYSNPDGLIEKISQGTYDSVFLDIVMPNQDGYKFLRALRSNPLTAKQHVIFCSSKKTPIEINYGIKRAGANEYLTKPVTRDTLTEILQKVPS